MQSESTNKQLLDVVLRIETRNEELLDAILQTQEALHSFATDVDRRFDEVNNRLGGMEQRMGGMEQRLSGVEGRVGGIEQRMVTKDYLDDKLADQGAYLGGLIRETNGVIGNLTDAIVTAGSLPRPVGERIKRQRPFFKAAK